MKVALILCCYNRPKYLRECLQSLSKSDLSNVYEVNLFDDGSVDIETRKLITEYNLSHDKTTTSRSEVNQGIKLSLLHLYDFYFSNTSAYDIVINIDSDAIVRYDFINQLLLNYLRGTILTGFHSETKNSNGTDRHKILSENEYTYKKQSVGGINFCIDKEAYNNYVNPALKIAGNWDHNSCINAGEAYCLKESVIEHIGFDSSMNHNEQPDISANFHFHNLSNVTLVCVDGRGGEYINNPISIYK
jgi:glycosyltransferase involved in cell wall biosynthesis